MSDFRIDWTNLDGFVTGLRAAPRIIGDEFRSATLRIASRGASLSRSYAPVWKGEARDSVYSKAEVTVNSFSAVWGASSEHAYFADQGRRPGKMPPKGALVGWHGVTEAEEFVVRRAIGRRGTKGKPFVTRAFKELSRGFAQTEFSQAVARALRRIGGG